MPIIERYEKRDMVRKVSGIPPPDQVNSHISILATDILSNFGMQVFEEVKQHFLGL